MTTHQDAAPAQFDPRRSDKVSDRVARQILADALEMTPGSMLPGEAQMVARYGVGRGSVREALRILEVHGLVRVKPGPGGGPRLVGATGRDFGRSMTLFFQTAGAKMQEILESRLLVEPLLARQAAERIDENGVAALRDVCARGHSMLDDPGPGWAAASFGFHQCVGQLTQNHVMSLFAEALGTIQYDRLKDEFTTEERPSAVRIHDNIADAIIAGDGDLAELLMMRHLQAVNLRTLQDWPGLLSSTIEWA